MKSAGQLMWPEKYDCSRKKMKMQSRNACVMHELNPKMPQFHSREMRRSFVCLFGSVANIRPVYL